MSHKILIGQLAEQTNVTPRMIRHYESLGLLGPVGRRAKGFREYTGEAVARLNKIHALQQLGLTLEQISGVIDLYFADGAELRAKQEVVKILETQLRETEHKIESLTQFRADLQSHIARFKQYFAENSAKEAVE